MRLSTFSVLFFHPAIFAKKSIFLLARVLHIAVCPGNSLTKQQKSQQRRITMLPLPLIISGITTIYNIIEYINSEK